MFNIYFFFTTITSLLIFGIGSLVFVKNKKNLINLAFFFICIFTPLWLISVFLSDYLRIEFLSLLFTKLANIFAILAIYCLFFFTTIFPRESSFIFKKFKFYFFLVPIGLCFLFIGDFIIKGVKFEEWGSNPILGSLFILPVVYFILTSILIASNLIIKYRTLKDLTEKLQIKYIGIGLGITLCLAILFSVVIPILTKTAKLTRLAPITTLFFILFTALAITRYHLFGIEVILTEVLIGVIGIILIVQIFSAPTVLWRIVNGVIFVLFCIFGWLLIRGVFKEMKMREEAIKMAARERKLRIEMERLNAARTQILLSAQHYFRTPLTSIIGYIEMMLEGVFGEVPPKVKEKLVSLKKSSEELRKRIEESLDITQFQLKMGVLNLKEIQIENLLKAIIEEFKVLLQQKNLCLKEEFPKEVLPKIKVDESRMREVFSNLIDNAIKHTLKGGITVGLKYLNEKNKILVWVKDTGIGIPVEELPYIGTAPFERGKEAKKLTLLGRGIGLYLSRLIVEAHGGKIWAESEGKNKGSTFFVELPIK